jgi:hypothetical protein
MKQCIECEEFFDYEEFRSGRGIVLKKCSQCRDIAELSKKPDFTINTPEEMLIPQTRWIVRGTRELLEEIGYDLDKDIHQQFLVRMERIKSSLKSHLSNRR